MQYFIKIALTLLVILDFYALKADYPDFDITVNGDPYPSKLFVHSMSSVNPHMGILNPDLSLHWNINSVNLTHVTICNNPKLRNFIIV